jgi:hypothetical protein
MMAQQLQKQLKKPLLYLGQEMAFIMLLEIQLVRQVLGLVVTQIFQNYLLD